MRGLVLIIMILMDGVCGRLASAQHREVLSPERFIENVKRFHPMARLANLVTDQADAGLLAARGGFDPVVEMDNQQKMLDGVNYYQYTNPTLKLPTPLGIDIKTGIERSRGTYINPELTNGVASYVGVEIPLLKGLLLDQRRAVLQQAKIYIQQSEEERRVMINDLLFDAYMAYWQWAAAYELYAVYKSYVDNAATRIRLVKIAYQNGDLALADTVEAFAQYQQYQLLETGALLELNNRAIELSQFLWDANNQPYLLADNYLPDTARLNAGAILPDLDALLKEVPVTHPVIKTYEYKLKSLEVERKLKLQNLLPAVHLRANALSKGYYDYKGIDAAYLENNYKLGFAVKMPLLLRAERGAYQKVRITTKETALQLQQKRWELQNKVKQYANEIRQLKTQLDIASNMYQQFAFLLKTEEMKFSQGESSLFLINSRESKRLEMQQKLIDLRLKQIKAGYSLQWASGTIQ